MLSLLGELPAGIDLSRFDAVIIHCSLIAAHDSYLGPKARRILRFYSGLKVMFIRDEYRWVNDTISVIRYLGIDLLFTCVPECEIEKVSPREALPKLKKVEVLTGYVDARLTSIEPIPYAERLLDVGYRVRKISAWFGELGREKWLIAERFQVDAQRFKLRCDLSYDEADRLYGQAWIDFIRSCWAVLGVESGANVFDFTGELQKKVEAHEAVYPDAPFEAFREMYFQDLDGRIRMNQISPRCFEAAALRTMMILYEGGYSGILEPWRHYVPLKKDHSNVAGVVAALQDEKIWTRITDTAYREVALNGAYSFEAVVAKVDKTIEGHFSDKMRRRKPAYERTEFEPVTAARDSPWPQVRVSVHVLLFGMLRKLYRVYLFIISRIRNYRAAVQVVVRWVKSSVKIPVHVMLRSRLHGVHLIGNLQALSCVQAAGSDVQKQAGRAPFVIHWLSSQGRIIVRLATELILDEPGDNNSSSREVILKAAREGKITEFHIYIEKDPWGFTDPLVAGVRRLDGLVWLLRCHPECGISAIFPEHRGEQWYQQIICGPCTTAAESSRLTEVKDTVAVVMNRRAVARIMPRDECWFAGCRCHV